MAKGHRSQIKRARNANKDTRPSAKLSYARMSVQKACYVLDVIRGKDVQTALGILTYNPRYASSPNDHPHGGGEGKTGIGRPGPCTPWGKPALGLKTRKKNKQSNKLIVRRRDGKSLAK